MTKVISEELTGRMMHHLSFLGENANHIQLFQYERGIAMKKHMLAVVMMGILLALFVGCKDDETVGRGQLRMYLVDSPASYDSVVVVVKEVSVHSESQGWIVVNNTTRTFDLLRLTNGARAVLGEASLEAGTYTQVRLLLDAGSYVVVGGTRHPLTVPSGLETGIKLVHQFSIEANFLYELYLDFDANRSIVLTGNGTYQLKPTIRVTAAATTGTISGVVLPATHLAAITAMSATDTAGTFASALTGTFKVMALPPGSYSVRIQSTTSTQDTTLTGVSVTTGADTFIGTINW